jgi:choline monooxygenase
MGSPLFPIDPELSRASTLPAAFYRDPDTHRLVLDKVFSTSWQFIGDVDRLKVPGQCLPLTLLEGSLDEPLLLTRDADDRLHCVSNVCTHRGALVCEGDKVQPSLRCRYHGRRFELDGKFVAMPEFQAVEGFPSERDDLPRVASAQWHKFLFASLRPRTAFEPTAQLLDDRIGFLPFHELRFDAARSRDYLVRAHWALYCDNYLEGFHIPYVHSTLNEVLDYGNYRVELFDGGTLQLGVGSGGASVFELPVGHCDHGTAVAAYYYWLFPNLMINVYPWGVSINVVKPLAPDRTRVSFLSYVWNESLIEDGAGAGLDRVEREDEAVVESVQRGVRSQLYRAGRLSVAREDGVHHFHRMLSAALNT